jgi:hypothetical protein
MLQIIKLTPASVISPQAPSDVGDIIECVSGVAPAGWMLCQGQSLPVAAYPQLFAQIGYTYGGSGANFNLPNINVVTPTLYNAIRNPEMIVAQRSTSGSIAANTSGYTIDGWKITGAGLTVTAWSQINPAIPADASGNNWYPYIPYALRATISTASGALSAGHYVYFQQLIEGNLAATLKSGATSISFLVRSSITGTFSVSLRDSAVTYSYVALVTITSANVWQRVTIPNIPIFTASGTFPDGTAQCYQLMIGLAVGSTYSSSTTGSWIAGNFIGITGQTNFAATIGNTFDITAVQHEPNPTCNPYLRREIDAEWSLSQRYLQIVSGVYLGFAQSVANTYTIGYVALQTMRATPTISGATFTASAGANGVVNLIGASPNAIYVQNNSTGWTVGATINLTATITAEL